MTMVSRQVVSENDGQLGHLLVLPVETPKKDEDDEPIMLLALNSETSVPWDELEVKVRTWRSCLVFLFLTTDNRPGSWPSIWRNLLRS